MACHEIRGVYQICGTDRTVTETKVRAGETARLLGVVCEICLAVLIGVVADNLDRVLVCANGAVCTKTVELGFLGGEGSPSATSATIGREVKVTSSSMPRVK